MIRDTFAHFCTWGLGLEDVLASWGEPERAAHCADLYHGTQTMKCNEVYDCPLSVRAATIATHA